MEKRGCFTDSYREKRIRNHGNGVKIDGEEWVEIAEGIWTSFWWDFVDEDEDLVFERSPEREGNSYDYGHSLFQSSFYVT